MKKYIIILVIQLFLFNQTFSWALGISSSKKKFEKISPGKYSITNFPDEIMQYEIFKFLRFKDFSENIRFVCKTWYLLSNPRMNNITKIKIKKDKKFKKYYRELYEFAVLKRNNELNELNELPESYESRIKKNKYYKDKYYIVMEFILKNYKPTEFYSLYLPLFGLSSFSRRIYFKETIKKIVKNKNKESLLNVMKHHIRLSNDNIKIILFLRKCSNCDLTNYKKSKEKELQLCNVNFDYCLFMGLLSHKGTYIEEVMKNDNIIDLIFILSESFKYKEIDIDFDIFYWRFAFILFLKVFYSNIIKTDKDDVSDIKIKDSFKKVVFVAEKKIKEMLENFKKEALSSIRKKVNKERIIKKIKNNLIQVPKDFKSDDKNVLYEQQKIEEWIDTFIAKRQDEISNGYKDSLSLKNTLFYKDLETNYVNEKEKFDFLNAIMKIGA